jgi:hypothetical protein
MNASRSEGKVKKTLRALENENELIPQGWVKSRKTEQ